MSFRSQILHKRPPSLVNGVQYRGRPNPHASPPYNPIRQLTCTECEETRLMLDWEKYTSEWKVTYYNMEISNDKTEWFPIPPTTPYIEGNVINLQPDTEYYFRVRAHNHKGYSPWSAVTAAKTESLPPQPTKPTNIAVDKSFIDPNRVKLQWDASPKEEKITSYVFNYQIVGEKTLQEVIMTDIADISKKQVNHFILSNLAANSMYNITIRGKNIVGDGESSTIKCKIMQNPKGPPEACLPPFRDPNYYANDKINLMWIDNESEDIHKYCIFMQSGDSWKKIADVANTFNQYMVDGLTENSTYVFKIQACNKGIQNNSWVVQEGAISASSKPIKTAPKPSDETAFTIVPKKATDGSIGYFKSANIGQLTDKSMLERIQPKHFIRKIYTSNDNKLYLDFATKEGKYIKGAITQLSLVEQNGNIHTLSKTLRNREGLFYWETNVTFAENKSYSLHILNILPVNYKNIHFTDHDAFKGNGGIWDSGLYKGQPIVNSYVRIKICVRSKKQDEMEESFTGQVLRYGKWSKNTITSCEIYNSLIEVRKVHGAKVDYNTDVGFEIRENDTGLYIYYLDNREIISASAKLYMTNSFFSRRENMEKMLIKEIKGRSEP